MITLAGAALLASSTTVDLGQLGIFLQFGLLGVLFVMLITKKFVVPRWTLDALAESYARELALKDAIIADKEDDITELKGNLASLQTVMRDRALPALQEANRLQALYIEELARRDDRRGSRD